MFILLCTGHVGEEKGMEEESTAQHVEKIEGHEENGNHSKRARISYDLTKSFTYAQVAGTTEAREKTAEVNEGLSFDGDVHIVNQM